MFGFKRGEGAPPPPQIPAGSASAALVADLSSLLDEACPEWRSAVQDYAAQCSTVEVKGNGVRREVPYRKEDRANLVALIESNPVVLLALALELNAGAQQADRAAAVTALTGLAGGRTPHERLAFPPSSPWSETLLLQWEEFSGNDFGFGMMGGPGSVSSRPPRPMSLPRQLSVNVGKVVSAVVAHDVGSGAVGPLAPARVDLVAGVREAVVLLSAQEVLRQVAVGHLDESTEVQVQEARDVLSERIAEAAGNLRGAVERHRELQSEFSRLHRAAEAEHAASLREPAAAEAVARVSALLEQPASSPTRVRVGPVPPREGLGY